MALFIDTYSEQYRTESSMLDASRVEGVEKAKMLVEEKTKSRVSTKQN